MTNIYQFTKNWPAHLSVGCVLLNQKNEVALLHFAADTKYGKMFGREFYLLMRETIEGDESLKTAVNRGLMEEMGARGYIVAFLGSVQSDIHEELAGGLAMRKTTLYHLASLEEIDDSKRKPNDEEKDANIVWLSLGKARRVFEAQAAHRPDRHDINESVVINWAEEYLKTGK